MGIVLMLHSLWRWVVVLVALVALVRFGLGWLQRKNPELLDRRLTLAFTTVIDIQVLLGILVLALQAVGGTLRMPAIEHAGVMILVAILAHATALWRTRDENAVLRNNFLDVVAVLILIVIGVSIVNGWHF
jgi:hypothetical protein